MTPRAAAVAAFVSVALAGVLVGAALDRYVLFLWGGRPERGVPFERRGGPEGNRFDRDRGPGGGPGGMRGGGPGGRRGGGRGDLGPGPDFLARELNLSEDQRHAIDSLMSRQAEKLRTARERVRPAMDSVFAETQREIEQRLTADQRTKYRDLQSRMRPPGGERGRPPR